MPAEENKPEALDPTIMALIGAVDETAPAPEAKPEPVSRPGRSITDAIDEPPDETPPPPKKPDEKPAGEAAAPAKETPPAERPIRVRRRAEPAPTPPPVPVAPPPPAPVAKTPDQELEETLLPEEKEQLENARYAEAKFPKHAGLAARTAKFLREHAALTEKPDFDPESDDYKAWLAKNSVAISPRDMREIEREKDREIIRADMAKESAATNDDVFQQLEEPKVKAEADQLYAQMANEALPEDLLKTIREKGSAVAAKEFPVEYKIAADITAAATSDMEEFMRITRVNPKTGRTLRAYDPANAQHTRIIEFVNDVGASFKAAGKGLVRDGQSFLTREEYFSVPKDKRAPYWTFTNRDIITQAKATAKVSIGKMIAAENARLADMGYVRTKAAPAATPPPAGAPPAPRSAVGGSGENVGDSDPISKSMKMLYGEE